MRRHNIDKLPMLQTIYLSRDIRTGSAVSVDVARSAIVDFLLLGWAALGGRPRREKSGDEKGPRDQIQKQQEVTSQLVKIVV